MPIYNYKCRNCANLQEQLFVNYDACVGANVVCEVCDTGNMKKTLEGMTFYHNTGYSKSKDFVMSELRRAKEMRQELKEDYNVEKITPLKGQGLDSIYNNVKSNSDQVKDDMQKQIAENRERTEKRQSEWKKAAAARYGRKKEELLARRKKEASDNLNGKNKK